MFKFSWVNNDIQTGLEIAPLSKVDALKATDKECDRYYLGRKKKSLHKWFLVGETLKKKEVIKSLNKTELRRVVGYI